MLCVKYKWLSVFSHENIFKIFKKIKDIEKLKQWDANIRIRSSVETLSGK